MKRISTIFSIIGVISAIGLVLFNVTLMNERTEVAQERLDEARQEGDRIVNRAIEYCAGETNSECDQLMVDWFEECKKEDLTKIPSCHDGRILSYLETNKLIETNNDMIKSTSTNPLNEKSLLLFDSCIDALDRLNNRLQFMAPESEESKILLDNFKPVREDCNASVEDIKNYCQREKGTSNYFEACDDPRLDRFPI